MRPIDVILQRADELGLTQGELEERAKLSQGRISKWKSGKGEPYFSQVASLAEAVGLSLDELAGLSIPGPKTPDEAMVWRIVGHIGAQAAFGILMDALPRPRVRLEESTASDEKQETGPRSLPKPIG